MIKYSNKSQALQNLKEYRENGEVVNPLCIIELAKPLIDKKFGSMNEIEKYEVIEQLITAYLDINDIDKANEYLAIVEKKVPRNTSTRIQKLFGMVEEAKGNFDEAIKIYNEALKLDELNEAVHKRLIAVNITIGKRTEAIKLLNTYLETFVSGDEQAWLQLSDLYMAENMCQQAAYCIEEVILINPKNHLYFLRYADIMCCLCKYQVASKYYCQALELSKNNVRALYGILYTNQNLLKVKDEDKTTSDETIKALIDLAKEELTKIYKKTPNESIIKEYLQ